MLNFSKLLFVFTIALFMSACGFKYSWTESEIETGTITAMTIRGNAVAENGQNDDTNRVIYSMGGSTYSTNYKELSDGLSKHLNLELNKLDSTSSPKEKKLTILVTDIQHSSDLVNRAYMEVTVIMGNGKKVYVSVKDSSDALVFSAGSGITGAINNAIASATIKILEDTQVRKYLKK